MIGDSIYFICEKLENAIKFVVLFSTQCIDLARGYKRKRNEYLAPFLVRGGMAFGPVLLSFSDAEKSKLLSVSFQEHRGEEKNKYDKLLPFNATGLPVLTAYRLSDKPTGFRVIFEDNDHSVKKDNNYANYAKYFSELRDPKCYEFLWPLRIFEEKIKKKEEEYIQESLEAFWYLYEENRNNEHKKHYTSTLALLWKSIDNFSGCRVAEEFFEAKPSDDRKEIKDYKDQISDPVRQNNDICQIGSNKI
jgi:hypothetical protein